MVASNESSKVMFMKGFNNTLPLESFLVMPLQKKNSNTDTVQKSVNFSGLIEIITFLSIHLPLSLKIVFTVKLFGQLMEQTKILRQFVQTMFSLQASV